MYKCTCILIALRVHVHVPVYMYMYVHQSIDILHVLLYIVPYADPASNLDVSHV